MNKPDYRLEQSKAKRAADLIEFAEYVLSVLDRYEIPDTEGHTEAYASLDMIEREALKRKLRP